VLVVTVEVWPGGDPRRKQCVGWMTAVNESALAENSRYDVHVDGESVGTVRHRRSDGAWALVRKCMRFTR